MSAFNFGVMLGMLNQRRRENKRIIKEEKRILAEAKKYNDDIIAKTEYKRHYSTKARIVAKDKTSDDNYSTVIEFAESFLLPGANSDFKGDRLELKGRENYLSGCEGDIVDIHFNLRFNKDGKLLDSTKGNDEYQISTVYNKDFLNTP